ncbi:hypothetical protein [Sunxiuqinia indica]|uniref:hypothetical protein n=1 Tax=Sunxiuqinia indica TaxID=2692584 RepID=UPI00135BFC9D|nr:hypothetical protein [Sunxiuqinia indica]
MKTNGHELETKYLHMINELKRASKNPHWSDRLWQSKYKKKLTRRLEKMETDKANGLIHPKAFAIWKSMINEVL